jgi:hypothetical protein
MMGRGDGFWEEQFLGNGDLDEERRSFLGRRRGDFEEEGRSLSNQYKLI